jgi:hypothetical protein
VQARRVQFSGMRRRRSPRVLPVGRMPAAARGPHFPRGLRRDNQATEHGTPPTDRRGLKNLGLQGGVHGLRDPRLLGEPAVGMMVLTSLIEMINLLLLSQLLDNSTRVSGKYRESRRSYPLVFSATFEEMSFAFSLFSVALPFVLDHDFRRLVQESKTLSGTSSSTPVRIAVIPFKRSSRFSQL